MFILQSTRMLRDPQNTSGGPAVHAGANYQNRVAAWSAVQILAGQDAVPDWDLPAGVTLESLQAEARSAAVRVLKPRYLARRNRAK